MQLEAPPDLSCPFSTPTQIRLPILTVGILPVADSEIVRRRRHHEINAFIREPRHYCGAILPANIKIGHEKEFRVDKRFVQAETNPGVLLPGSIGPLTCSGSRVGCE